MYFFNYGIQVEVIFRFGGVNDTCGLDTGVFLFDQWF